MPEIHLDDLEPGQIHDLGRRTLERDEIVAFARDWDPQPFHLDEQSAAASIYGGLIASGWHTVCVFMRLFADGLLARAAAMGSPGVDELRWLKPVRPGDTLEARLEVLDVRPSRSRPDRGIVRARSVALNQHGEEVLTFVATLLFRRRPEDREAMSPGDIEALTFDVFGTVVDWRTSVARELEAALGARGPARDWARRRRPLAGALPARHGGGAQRPPAVVPARRPAPREPRGGARGAAASRAHRGRARSPEPRLAPPRPLARRGRRPRPAQAPLHPGHARPTATSR